MSRLAKRPVQIPNGVELKQEAEVTLVKGPKGEVKIPMVPGLKYAIDNQSVLVQVEGFIKKSFLGLYRSLLMNAIEGVTKGFKKELTLIGVGFRSAVQGNHVDMQLGFSHPTKIEIPKELKVTVNKGTSILVEGPDKQLVGQFAATLRALRKPEPYKGKGVRYVDEFVRKKAGKSSK